MNFNTGKQIIKNEQEQSRSKLIRDYCIERGIRKLFHFTRIENLSSILHLGLLGRKILREVSDIEPSYHSTYNDEYRLDGHPEAVCLSIGFPNYKMFYKLSHKNQSEWVVLVLEPYILWEFDCAFYTENAASNVAKHIPLSERKSFSAFKKLYMDYNGCKRQDLGIPHSYPTHPQAEVLVLEPISPKYIKEVDFKDKQVMQEWLSENKGKFAQKFIFDTLYFTPRDDWAAWKNNY
jgi:hypothetical protein